MHLAESLHMRCGRHPHIGMIDSPEQIADAAGALTPDWSSQRMPVTYCKHATRIVVAADSDTDLGARRNTRSAGS